MKKSLNFILLGRDTTVGHWRFRGNLSDLSGEGNNLTGSEIVPDDYDSGYSENGTTVLVLSEPKFAYLSSGSASDFDMGMNDFDVKVIMRPKSGGSDVREGIIQKMSDAVPLSGWSLSLKDADNKVSFKVADGTNFQECVWSSNLTNGKWYRVTVTVNRTTDEAILYIDGSPFGSPVDISSVTGNISNAAQDLLVGKHPGLTTYYLEAEIDEVCVSKGEALTALAVADQDRGRFKEVSPYRERFLLNFLPLINHDNSDLLEFLIPFNTRYLDLQNLISDLGPLVSWAECPERFITHLASMTGFELIDIPFADENERRNFLKWILWIYRRKGNKAAGEKIISLLGFTSEWTEAFPDFVPFIANFHRSWQMSLIVTSQFFDDFSGNLSRWNILNLSSWWRITNQELRGTGDGSDNDLNGIVFDDTSSAYYFETKFEVVSGFANPTELGIFLRYVDSDNWLKFELQTDASGDDFLVLVANVGGAETQTVLGEITDLVVHETGEHTLWIWDDGDDHYTAGIDKITVAYKTHFTDAAALSRTKKGLWVNRNLTVSFDDVAAKVLDTGLVAKTFHPNFSDRSVQIELSGTPSHAASKENYLREIIPKYVPAGVEVDMPLPILYGGKIYME